MSDYTRVNLKDGAPVWKVNRNEDDLYVAGVFDGPPAKDGKEPPKKAGEKKPGQPVALGVASARAWENL